MIEAAQCAEASMTLIWYGSHRSRVEDTSESKWQSWKIWYAGDRDVPYALCIVVGLDIDSPTCGCEAQPKKSTSRLIGTSRRHSTQRR